MKFDLWVNRQLVLASAGIGEIIIALRSSFGADKIKNGSSVRSAVIRDGAYFAAFDAHCVSVIRSF